MEFICLVALPIEKLVMPREINNVQNIETGEWAKFC